MHRNAPGSKSNIYSILDLLGLSAQQVLNKKTNIKKVILSTLCFKYSQCWKYELFNDNRKNPNQKKVN